MTEEEQILELKNRIIKAIPEREHSELSLGPTSRVCLEQPDLDIKVQIGTYKSQLKNYELAKTLIELVIEDYVHRL